MKTYTKIVEQTNPMLEITYDTHPDSPRNWSNLGYMICKMRNYDSPDKNNYMERLLSKAYAGVNNVDEHKNNFKQLLTDEGYDVLFIEPISKYEHSGIKFFIGDSSGFDTGVVGFYIITSESIKECFGEDIPTYDRMLEIVESEIEIYNKYVNGEVYEFVLYDEEGNIEDSCSGFYNIDEIKDHLPEEWKDEDLSEYFVY